ncbi:MAG: hypothetical protein LBF34_03095 [Puniceicoccales bacterium]|jgi:hypothetical protein|nr:hypothetical protein [Puniceicoccales bacterium]
MQIKTITDKVWSELCLKPFIAIGFHAYQSKIIAIAVDNDGIYALKIIADDHDARQNFFSEISTRCKGSPIAIFPGKTGRFLENLSAEKNGKQTTLQIVLKGPEDRLGNWESEIKNVLSNREIMAFSDDNPIQCLNL